MIESSGPTRARSFFIRRMTVMERTTRNYDEVARSLRRLDATGSREERMTAVVDALWSVLEGRGVSWLGFYLDVPDAEDHARLVLGPHRDSPACSPIGLHGVCGQALVSRGTLTASLVHPREVFRPALAAGAAALLLVHNHPSGDPTPSPEDREITRRLHAQVYWGHQLDDVATSGDLQDDGVQFQLRWDAY